MIEVNKEKYILQPTALFFYAYIVELWFHRSIFREQKMEEREMAANKGSNRKEGVISKTVRHQCVCGGGETLNLLWHIWSMLPREA